MTNTQTKTSAQPNSTKGQKIKTPPYSTAEQKALHDILQKAYPVIDSKNLKPLAIGIFKELQEKSGLEKKRLEAFFNWYCGPKYQSILKAGEPRYNLNNEIVGEVTLEEETHTTNQLEKRNLNFVIDRLFVILVAKGETEKLQKLFQAGFKPSNKVDLINLAKKLTTKSDDVLNILSKYNLG
jgi:sRNA-binding protein